MFFALGFLAAALLALTLLPAVHARAMRLAARRILVDIPISMSEIYADRDARRAEFAIATRRLEMRIEALTVRMADQRAQLGRKSDEVNRLKIALAAKGVQAPSLEPSADRLPDCSGETPAAVSAFTTPSPEGSLRQQLARLSELNPDFANSPLVPSGNEVPSAARDRAA